MMDLPAATRKLVSGDARADTEPGSVAELLDIIRAAFGVHPPPGIPERTWRRARNQPGWTPSPATLARLRTAQRPAQRRVRLPRQREQFLRAGPHVTMDADVQVSSDERPRFIILTDWHNKPDLGVIVDNFLIGDDQAAADHIVEQMEAEIGSSVTVRNVRHLEAHATHAAAQGRRWSR